MSDFSKSKVLALYRILAKYTDEQHQMSMQEILTHMELEGYPSSSDSVGRYIEQLQNELGVDVISCRGRNARYFIANRLLGKEELRLIVDAINASNFIDRTNAEKMITKLKETLSDYEAKELDRNVLGVSVAKAENRKILYNVDKIQKAIEENVQIEFNNLAWSKDKKLVKKNARLNTINPWALIWANDRYYLFGYDVKEKNGKFPERHYRVDKMADIQLTDVPRDGEKQFRRFDASTYVSRRIGMFSGEEQMIKVRIPEYLVGAFIDQFGKKIDVSAAGNESLQVTFHAVPSDMLFGWLVGMGQVEVLEPESVVTKMKELIESNRMFYEEKN